MTWTAFNINAPKKQTTTTTNEYLYVVFILFYVNYMYFSLFYIYILLVLFAPTSRPSGFARLFDDSKREKESGKT